MVFPSTIIPINPLVFNPCDFGNMVNRNVWNQSAQVLREISRITNQIHENLNQPQANCSTSTNTNCASSSSSSGSSSASASSSVSSSACNPNVSSINGDTFEVKVQVDHFKPEEISVKLINSTNLIVEGKHEERSDNHGFISRSFSRRYIIPDNYDSEKLESQLSLNGILTIKAPRKPIKGANGEKIIPITLTSNILSSVDETINKSTETETIPIIKTSSSSSQDGNNQLTNIDASNQEKPEASTKDD